MSRTNRTISNRDKILNSRDVIAKLEEMTDERQVLVDALEEAQQALGNFDAENGVELKALKDFCEEGESNSSDWPHGETLIHEDHFREYAEQLAIDCAGSKEEADLIRNGGGSHWPLNCMRIDWDDAAEQLKQDYAEIEWDGETYLIRSS